MLGASSSAARCTKCAVVRSQAALRRHARHASSSTVAPIAQATANQVRSARPTSSPSSPARSPPPPPPSSPPSTDRGFTRGSNSHARNTLVSSSAKRTPARQPTPTPTSTYRILSAQSSTAAPLPVDSQRRRSLASKDGRKVSWVTPPTTPFANAPTPSSDPSPTKTTAAPTLLSSLSAGSKSPATSQTPQASKSGPTASRSIQPVLGPLANEPSLSSWTHEPCEPNPDGSARFYIEKAFKVVGTERRFSFLRELDQELQKPSGDVVQLESTELENVSTIRLGFTYRHPCALAFCAHLDNVARQIQPAPLNQSWRVEKSEDGKSVLVRKLRVGDFGEGLLKGLENLRTTTPNLSLEVVKTTLSVYLSLGEQVVDSLPRISTETLQVVRQMDDCIASNFTDDKKTKPTTAQEVMHLVYLDLPGSTGATSSEGLLEEMGEQGSSESTDAQIKITDRPPQTPQLPLLDSVDQPAPPSFVDRTLVGNAVSADVPSTLDALTTISPNGPKTPSPTPDNVPEVAGGTPQTLEHPLIALLDQPAQSSSADRTLARSAPSAQVASTLDPSTISPNGATLPPANSSPQSRGVKETGPQSVQGWVKGVLGW